MRMRLLMILLLILAMICLTGGQTLASGQSLAEGQERELSPEEEEEARDVARRFSERWEAKNDFGQIIDELFVKDFQARLWQTPHDELPWMLLDKNLDVAARPEDMKRYYIAAMSFYGLYFNLHETIERLREKSEDSDRELGVTEVLSPEVINILLSNQTFVKLAELAGGTESDERTEEEDNRQSAESRDSAQAARATTQVDEDGSGEQSETGIITKVPQLNEASATLEKANQLMRKRLVERLAELALKAQSDSGKEEDKNEENRSKLNFEGLYEEEYGYPKDTPVVHLHSMPFCLYLTKIDGRFRILAAGIHGD